MGTGWSMSVDDAINESHDAILVVTDALRHDVVARSIATRGRFIVACHSGKVADVLALFRFRLVILLADLPPVARVLVKDIFTRRKREGCALIDDLAEPIVHIGEKAA